MASFGFLPRSVKGKGKAVEHAVENASPNATATTSSAPTALKVPKPRAARIPTADPEDIRALFSMALSSYSIFLEPSVRRLLERDEYIRLAALLKASPMLGYLPSGIPEAQIISALRELPSAIRPEMRFGQQGYELHFPRRILLQHTHAAWEECTVYVENIPAQARTMAGVYRALSHLLPDSQEACSSKEAAEPPIHHISFPAGQHNRGQQERFRGFAFVVFKSAALAEEFFSRWPWEVSDNASSAADGSSSDESDSEDSDSETRVPKNGHTQRSAINQAKRFGFRALSKASWTKLKAEYLAEQHRLLELSRPQPSTSKTQEPVPLAVRSQRTPSVNAPKRPLDDEPPYPTGCLAFARGLPLPTNKTALKAIFSAALGGEGSEGVDYVDWTKGMDTCYIRFSTPDHAQRAVLHFRDADSSTIKLELISGERERIYWEKVPEHLRKQAVERASAAAKTRDTAERPGKRRRGAG